MYWVIGNNVYPVAEDQIQMHHHHAWCIVLISTGNMAVEQEKLHFLLC